MIGLTIQKDSSSPLVTFLALNSTLSDNTAGSVFQPIAEPLSSRGGGKQSAVIVAPHALAMNSATLSCAVWFCASPWFAFLYCKGPASSTFSFAPVVGGLYPILSSTRIYFSTLQNIKNLHFSNYQGKHTTGLFSLL